MMSRRGKAVLTLALIASTGLLHALPAAIAEELAVHALLGLLHDTWNGLPVFVPTDAVFVTDPMGPTNCLIVDTRLWYTPVSVACHALWALERP